MRGCKYGRQEKESKVQSIKFIGSLHTLLVKYAGIANKIFDGLLPIARGLPIVPKNILQMQNVAKTLTAILPK
jgi:hypothetical protein